MKKYVCGRCQLGFDDLQIFGDHPCNPALAAINKAFNLHGFSIDVSEMVEQAMEKQRIADVVNDLEAHLRRGDLSA